MDTRTRKSRLGKLLLMFSIVSLGFLSVIEISANGETGKYKPIADFDGDGKSDISVFRPSDGFWYIHKSSGGYLSIKWGLSTDALVPGDYDGDGKTDVAVYRLGPSYNFPVNPADYFWYIRKSADNELLARTWGTNIFIEWDTPVPADYDGDGKTDLAVYTLSDAIGGPGKFKILQSSTDSANIRNWGVNTDVRVPADYDGDGKADVAVFRGNTFSGTQINIWYILQSSTGTVQAEHFGSASDRRVPADYDGVWYRINSGDNSYYAISFGATDDKPTPADYDGDGKTDIAVYRPSNGVWYLLRSTEGFTAEAFGVAEDIPIPNTFVR